MKIRTLCLFVYLLLVITTIGALTVSFAQERLMGGVGITVFNDQNFRGKSSSFRQDVPNLDPLGINDKISSLRVGPGEQWEVCEHADYQGRCVVVSGEESDLRRNDWNDIISSMRRVSGGGPPPRPPSHRNPYIILYDRTVYRGNPTNYNGPVPDLYGLNRRAQSVTIGRGAWELCEGRNFTGRCVTLDVSVPDLSTYNLRNRISSVRPIGSGGPIPPPTSDWYIVLYDQTTYRGSPTNYTAEESNLNQRARSVTIGRGVWELCEGRNFSGRCVTLNRSVPDLRSYDFSNRVRSLRPVIRQPR
ncbi:MAG: beta/gamma crystallin family protein [Pyrinomonadaceae bacterium]|nr:beta/gamma crystallin family protein [Pyrinomonadaceae bacterium]